MIQMLREYTAKFGEVDQWSLAQKFHVLFQVIKLGANKGTFNSGVLNMVGSLLYSLSSIPNSGVTAISGEVKDKHFRDSQIREYVCGKAHLHYECYTEIKNGWADKDCFLSVTIDKNVA